MNIRFINRDGKMILQHRSPCDFKGTNPPFKIEEVWTDVPTHQEPKCCEYSNCWKCRENATWDKAKKAQEPKKVGLVEDLAEHLLEATAYDPNRKKSDGGWNDLVAKAAIEFFKKRISGLPATQALRQCEQALFGEA